MPGESGTEFVLSIPVELLPAEEGRLADQVLDDGYGVFAVQEGISSAATQRTTLRSIHEKLKDAAEERDRLTDAEGFVTLEVETDPESNVLDSRHFHIGRVTMQDLAAIVQVKVTYALVEEE